MKRLVAGGALLLALCGPGRSIALEEVPFVTTPTPVVQGILDLAAVGPSDFIIDLGSGDGRIVIAAARERGARGFGVEIDGRLVDRANEAARGAGVADRAEFLVQDIFETVLSPATVVTMYLLPDVNLALRPRLLGMLRPGTRIVTHDYDMGDWEPDARVHLQAPGKTVGLRKESDLFLWLVPADVTGRWRAADGTVLEFSQRFQKVSVRVRGQGRTRIVEGRLRGDALEIPASGPGEPGWRLRVEGERLVGTRVDAAGGEQAWLARRDGK